MIVHKDKNTQLLQSDYISRDLSWLKFNDRVLDQVNNPDLNLFEKFKFLAIASSNLDEFQTVRVGSLYNYLDFDKQRIDYSGLDENTFRKVLLKKIKKFVSQRSKIYRTQLQPKFIHYGFKIIKYETLNTSQKNQVNHFFDDMIYPMLTPMVYDQTHVFPSLLPENLILGIITLENQTSLFTETEEQKKVSFVQIPANLSRFYELKTENEILFLPLEEVIRNNLYKLYKNVTIVSSDLFRIIRNGDFEIEDYDHDENIIHEMKEKIRGRKLERVVFMIAESSISPFMKNLLKEKWKIDNLNILYNDDLMDFTCLWEIINHQIYKPYRTKFPQSVLPENFNKDLSIFDNIKENDILLHHPYNSFEPVLNLIEKAADDPNVLSIKLTIYRLAKNSRVTAALLRAAKNHKHVSVLIEIKARFDEENNIREAEKLQKAGCFVIYGIGWFKTHTKLMLIVRKENDEIVQYAHLASGNYNEDTLKTYSDLSFLTTRKEYTKDITEFFNVITGHSKPDSYQYLITSPSEMRKSLLTFINEEIKNSKQGKPSGICLKVNSLEDRKIIDTLYKASQAGVKVELIVRGICCLRPGKKGLSENIKVRSLVGNYLEHARVFYFHNIGNPKVFVGSADIMVRSFDKRIESIFQITNINLKKQLLHILSTNLMDNYNTYELKENGEYQKIKNDGKNIINTHRYLFKKQTDHNIEKLF